MRSCAPVRMFTSGVSVETLPEMTFKYESLPTNGSATVLNTSAAAAPSSLTESSTGLPSVSSATSPAWSAADGASQMRPLSSCSMP